jgi:hypothetical protein
LLIRRFRIGRLRRAISVLSAAAFMAVGASLLVSAQKGWYPVGAILFLMGVVIAFVLIGDWFRAWRPTVD